MDKIINWIVLIIGLLLILAEAGWLAALTQYNGWLIALGVTVIGILLLKKK